MIQVTHLTKRFGKQSAISDLNFHVRAGEVVGVLGPNGAGKTTTFRCLSGLLEPTEGEVRVLDVPVAKDPFLTRRILGYLPEGNPLSPDLTVREYLDFRIHLKLDSPQTAATTVEKSLQICALKDVENRVIRRLSHGFKRRVGLAEALLGSPQLLLLDEPTNGLDPEQVVQIRKLLSSLKSTHTVLIASHILSELDLLCDRFLILSNGTLKAWGSREELLALSKQSAELHLEISEADTDLIAKLRAVPGVNTVTVSRNTVVTIVLTMYRHASDPLLNDPREAIHACLKNASVILLQMRLEMPNLESLYLELTRNA